MDLPSSGNCCRRGARHIAAGGCCGNRRARCLSKRRASWPGLRANQGPQWACDPSEWCGPGLSYIIALLVWMLLEHYWTRRHFCDSTPVIISWVLSTISANRRRAAASGLFGAPRGGWKPRDVLQYCNNVMSADVRERLSARLTGGRARGIPWGFDGRACHGWTFCGVIINQKISGFFYVLSACSASLSIVESFVSARLALPTLSLSHRLSPPF